MYLVNMIFLPQASITLRQHSSCYITRLVCSYHQTNTRSLPFPDWVATGWRTVLLTSHSGILSAVHMESIQH